MFNSMKKRLKPWRKQLRNMTVTCSEIAGDTRLEDILPQNRCNMALPLYGDHYNVVSAMTTEYLFRNSRYHRVHYEELVDDTLLKLKDIYQWAGIHFNEETATNAFRSTHSEGATPFYFDIRKGPNFKHDKWKKELDEQVCMNL